MRVALVSPLPPAPTGVAEFAARIGAELARHAEVDLLDHPSHDALRGYDARLYQIGNNSLHRTAYEAALAVPGVVELHDAVLHHYLLGALSREQYVDEFVFNYGEWTRDQAASLWQRRSLSAAEESYFRYPLLRRVVEASEAVIVHNPAARSTVEATRKQVEAAMIPHYVDPPPTPTEAEVAATRAGLGVTPQETLIGCFGYQRPTKRLGAVGRAVERLPPSVRLLICGQFVSAEYEASLGPLLGSARVVRRPRVSGEELQRLMAASDIAVNLRHPAAGETSGIAMKLMALGKPVVVTAGAENEPFPDSALLRIDPGAAEREMLTAALAALVRNAELRRAIGREARSYVLQHCSLERVIPLYLDVLRSRSHRNP